MKNINLVEIAKEHPGMIVSISVGDLMRANQELIDNTKRDMEKQLEEANHETYLNVAKVTEMLGVDRSTLWRWSQSQYLVPIKIGGKIRYKMSDINKIINSQTTDEQ
ncbi:MAG: helix-turn-helix domain-containing protein [Bacteroidales bacterium]|nr:helix-turn-helix domain-containing protein [Bacteroidales bacterium]